MLAGMSNIKELEEKLKAVKARRAAAAVESDADKLAKLERQVTEEEAIEAAEAEYGPIGDGIALVRPSNGGLVIVRRPDNKVYKKFQDDAQFTSKAMLQFISAYIVYPGDAAFDALIEKLPAVVTHIADAATVLCGAKVETQLKKADAS
jgi:hypothetical protein